MGESSVCSLVSRDKVQYTSATEILDTVWKETTVPTNHSGLVYAIMETDSFLHKQEVVAHLFQMPPLHLGIGLSFEEAGYTLSFLL
ncbi:hypothetical protein AVEN_222210-1 [Araneus ventricosus]|uniref:Uncharacterized protein n=1 Tax=Araneus ventricosus TaxID=182803 RepID=A0A4Y2LCJ8_ARAVE|nr:hypothetical protein AVEN_222210-1 [Araneus ventricosus]